MTRNMTAYAALFLSLGGVALAQDAATMDTDGDGLVSFTEMLAAYPDMTEEVFTTIDASGDGLLDDEEMAAAVEAGLLAPMEG
jgi:Ca2+-binding EF-hand superfamily protein